MEEQDEQKKQINEGKPPKEQPVWLTQSTVKGAYSEPEALRSREYIFLSSEIPGFTPHFSMKVFPF